MNSNTFHDQSLEDAQNGEISDRSLTGWVLWKHEMKSEKDFKLFGWLQAVTITIQTI